MNVYTMVLIGSVFYIGESNGLIAIDINLNVLNEYVGDYYFQLYYNQKNNTLIAANTGANRIDIFDLTLVLIRSIIVSSMYGDVHGVYMYNDIIYAGSANGQVLITNNIAVVSSFNTLCPMSKVSLFFLYIDPCGVIAVPCYTSQKVYFYYINGTILSTQITTFTDNPNFIGRDYNDKLIILGDYTVFTV